MEKLLADIEKTARLRETTLKRVCDFLNNLNEVLYEKRIGRRVELPIEGVKTTQHVITHFGWGMVRNNWGLFVGFVRDGEVSEKLLQETQMRVRLEMLDRIPTLLSLINETLNEDVFSINNKLDMLEDLVQKF